MLCDANPVLVEVKANGELTQERITNHRYVAIIPCIAAHQRKQALVVAKLTVLHEILGGLELLTTNLKGDVGALVTVIHTIQELTALRSLQAKVRELSLIHI